MDWSAATWWWVSVGALVAVELTSGTFYLLMLALGAAAAALSAHGGVGLPGQLLVAALVGGGAVAGWYLKRGGQRKGAASRDVNLDIGACVHVNHWNANGSARVQYRGCKWDVRYQGEGTPVPGDYFIRGVDGSHLLLDK